MKGPGEITLAEVRRIHPTNWNLNLLGIYLGTYGSP
jgi:hypothetical protein